MSLHKYPFVRLFVPYALAIWFNERFVGAHYSIVFFALAALSLAVMVLSYFFNRSYPLRWLFGAGTSLLFFALGWLNNNRVAVQNKENHLFNDTATYAGYYVRVTAPPDIREKTVKLEAALVAADDGQTLHARTANMLVYLAHEEDQKLPRYGQLIHIKKAPSPVEGPRNPYQFDYRKYLLRKGVTHQVYLKSDEWNLENLYFSNPLYAFAFRLRNHLLQQLRLHQLEGDTYGVAAAILLGYDESLPLHLREGYTAAGAMHVLCVSGLHVGIVYIFLGFLLDLFFRNKKQTWPKTAILLISIWFYALLTGLSPSVQRSAIMLTFVMLAGLFRRKGYVINSIAASALFIMVIDPLVLFNVGFQLSYLAVLGIVLLQRPIYHLVYFKPKILDKIWEISSVALAAQLMTTPLVLHYFHQFPSYFLLGNLLLVPLSSVVIISGMSFLLLSPVPVLADLAGWITYGLIWIMNHAILLIEKLPGAVIKGLYATPLEALILFIISFLVFFILTTRSKKFIWPLLALSVLLLFSFSANSFIHHRQKALVIYGIAKHTAIHIIDGHSHFMIADSLLQTDTLLQDLNVKRHAVIRGLDKAPVWIETGASFEASNFVKYGPLLETPQRRIVLWEKDFDKKYHRNGKLQADLVLVTGKAPARLEVVKEWFNPKLIVTDLTVPTWIVEKWQAQCHEMHVEFHDIRRDGAVVIE